MKKNYLQTQTCTLLALLVFVASSNGQVSSNLPIDSLNEPKTIPTRQPKIIKPQGSNQGDNIRCGLQDKVGNLWFCTAGEGVYRYDGKLFTNFTEKEGLSNNTVWSMLEDKTGDLWFGTDSGLCRYDGKTFTSIPITVPNGSNLLFYISPNNNPSAKNAVWSMLQDKSGKLWFGTTDGVYCYDGKSFTRFLGNNSVINSSGLHLKMVDCILEDKTGNIWFSSGMGAFEGICRYDGRSITNFKPDGDGWIRCMLEDKTGNIWFGTRNHGIWRYDGHPKDGGPARYTNFTAQEGLGKIVYSVPAILEDNSGNIWFSNEESGVWCYDGTTFKNFTTKDGLINNSVWSIIEDRAGNIWVGTRNNGLHRYDGHPEDGGAARFISFTE